jgi:hypothetical protein
MAERHRRSQADQGRRSNSGQRRQANRDRWTVHRGKEIIGGYAIVETKTREEAIEIALRFMELRRTHDPDFEYESKILPVETA